MKFNEMIKDGMTVEEIADLVEKVSQSSADTVRTKYSQQIKELEGRQATQPTDVDLSEIETMKEELALLKQERESSARRKALEAAKLPTDLADVLNFDVTNTEVIAKLSEAFNSHALNSGYVPKGAHGKPQGVTKEEFSKMKYTERVELSKSNPDLFNALSK